MRGIAKFHKSKGDGLLDSTTLKLLICTKDKGLRCAKRREGGIKSHNIAISTDRRPLFCGKIAISNGGCPSRNSNLMGDGIQPVR